MTEVLSTWGHLAAGAIVFAGVYLVWRSVRDEQERNPGWHDYE